MASTLLAILERCGVRQRDIAQEFGVSRATVSRWAHGERRMTTPQQDRMLAWAQRATMAAHDDAAARDAATDDATTTILGAHRYATKLKLDLDELWDTYTWEIQPVRFKSIAFTILKRWEVYAQNLTLETFDPKPEEEQRLWEETRQFRAWLTMRQRLRHNAHPTEESDDGD